MNREKVMSWLEGLSDIDWRPYHSDSEVRNIAKAALGLLKEQETVKQKMWNALHAEEDELKKKYAGTNENDNWFLVYRPWLQRGFEIALHVVVEQESR